MPTSTNVITVIVGWLVYEGGVFVGSILFGAGTLMGVYGASKVLKIRKHFTFNNITVDGEVEAKK